MSGLLLTLVIAGGFGCGGFGIFYSNFDMTDMNKAFKTHGIEEAPSGYFGIGGGGFGGSDRLIFGGMGYGFSRKLSGQNLLVEAGGGMGVFNIGYNPFPVKPIKFFGLIGIGGAGYTWTFKPTQEPVTFDSLLANPRRFAEVEYSTFGFEIGGIVFLPFKQPKSERGGSIVGLAIKGSYFVPIYEEWKNSDGTELLDPPKFSYSGPSLAVFFIFGGEG